MTSVKIFFDGGCPFCSRYVEILRLRRSIGKVELVNLRHDAALRDELRSKGFDLNQGMVVEIDGRRLGGADAANALAILSTPSDLFNRLNRLLLSVPALAAIIYPILRSGRWISLFLMGRKGIDEKDGGLHSTQVLFSFLFSMFSLFHVFNYVFAYGRYPPQADLVAVFVAALILLMRPQSSRALFLLMLASLISTIAQAPAQSNHTMLRTMVIIGYWLSFLYAFLRGSGQSDIFGNFILAGRGGLLIMYVFGIFHKINSDFLNPNFSCAVALWRAMPSPLNKLEGPLIDYSTIYGTFVVEAVIVLALLIPRTRYLGMVFGILFHLLLALSDYAAYLAFTTLSISLHVLFLDSANSRKIMQSPEMAAIRSRIRHPLYKLAVLILLIVGALLMMRNAFGLSTIFLLPFVLPLCFLIMRYGRRGRGREESPYGRPAYMIGVVVAGLYFANGFMPYLGLKTAQSINMFSNLRLEAGVSNHLIFRGPPGPFRYLENVAVIEDAGGSAFLSWYQNRGFAIVYYDLLAHLAENPELVVSFELNGRQFSSVGSADFRDDIERTLHPRWVRKWFHFLPVQLERPEPCSI